MSDAHETAGKIVEDFCMRLPSEIREVSHLLGSLNAESQRSNEALVKLHAEVHRISGSAKCMGFPLLGDKLSDIEDNLETMLEESVQLRNERLINVASLIEGVARLTQHARPENSQLLRRARQKLKASGERAGQEKEKPLSVLFADDDLSIRHLMMNILSALGIERCMYFSNGRDLLNKAREFRPDLIITDWVMSPVSGFDILKAVRSGEAKIPADTGIIFLTSSNTLERVNRAIDAGVDDFLVKPFSQNTVGRSIHRVASRVTRGPRQSKKQIN